jgi:NAD(P)H-hydrate repair Nnr-like enzyme with NAD(P)H-hydrate dehydratase domain
MNWSKQTDEPLFPDVLWSRPENRRHAGKLLIIGGHAQNFSTVSDAYGAAGQAGAGTIRIIVPDKLRPMLSKVFMEAEYAASNEIGSFSQKAIAELLDTSEWADSVLLAGEFGKNSETAILIEDFISRYQGCLCVAGDTVDFFMSKSAKELIFNRPKTVLVASIAQLQKIASPKLIQQKADFIKIIEQVSDWAARTELGIVSWHSDKIISAYKDDISTTSAKAIKETDLAAYASVWTLQQPGKTFEALTTAVWCYSQTRL